jgi:predicted AAA+ superfamily ATPase
VVGSYREHGAGTFAQHRAFRWLGETGGLVPVPAPDAVGPDDLVGYREERELLRRNTVQFLAGFRANNVLLYGDRGTGKSSSVKALLHERSRREQGEPEGLWDALRIVEVPARRLNDFPVLAELLRTKPQRFILFVDDLSFEEGETQYKDTKAMLEGGLEARPANVVVYATSNRRHLVREQFADRASPDSGEVHAWDTVQEKLSFADRFGVTITFPTPDQAAYLAIVEGLAQRRGLLRPDGAGARAAGGGVAGGSAGGGIERAALRARAIEWAAWHNGRSGRTARQFVDYLEGELGLSGAAGG